MATPRLPFLWPMLTRGFEISNPNVRSAKAAARFRAFHATSKRDRPPQTSRYGTANEPPPHLGGTGMPPPTSPHMTEDQKALPKIGERLQKDGEAEVKAEQSQKYVDSEKEPTTVDGHNASAAAMPSHTPDGADSQPETQSPNAPNALPEHPMESVLETVPDPGQHSEDLQKSATSVPEDSPISTSDDEHAPPVKAPHINTPRHVHHFDTYGLVQRLNQAGWTSPQAITAMKGMRVLLSENMGIAREALVSKSQVENETYLFRAACAELKTEITTRRRNEQEKMRTQRTQLQHEVEILSQKLGQESGVMKDDLRGMFDDRKMAVRNEQRSMESKIQRLNYQITVDLQADAKSEVEALRWVMTRRVMIALATVIIMVIGSLKLYSNAVHDQDLDAKRRANMRSGSTQTDGSNGEDSGRGSLGGGEMVVREGDNPAFVSLG